MSDAYGFLAPFYQRLSRLVFGKDLIHANQAFLEGNESKRVLIIGGGDGIAYRNFDKNLQGEFWDLSPKMIQAARKNLGKSGLKIQLGNWPGNGKFDQVFLPFVLDTMRDDEIFELLIQIKASLLPNGKVVVSDFFEPLTFSQKILQKGMIRFFRIITSHSRTDLPDLMKIFEAEGFLLIKEKSWRKGWVRAQIWRPI